MSVFKRIHKYKILIDKATKMDDSITATCHSDTSNE